MEVTDQPRGVPDGWTIVPPAAPPQQAQAAPLAEVRMPAGVPARGRGTQFDPEKAQHGLALATTPLARPTGIDAIDGFTSPVGLASLALGGAGIVRAGVADGVMGGAKAALGQATPLLKYELTKSTLEKMGVPSPMAMAAAMVVSGYRGNGKHAPSNEAPMGVESAQEAVARRMASAPGASAPAAPAEPVASGPVAPAPQAAPVGRTAPPPPPSESAPVGPSNQMPDQRALNEEALARRRAAYQATQAATPPPAPVVPPQSPAKFVPTPAEMKEYMRLLRTGKTEAEAGRAIVAQRDLMEQFGLKAPTVEETKFPKGMRGGQPK